MNTILIISDTVRRDFLGAYGNEWISTPNLDRFAAEGLVFDRAYTASYATVPNRGDVHTGTYVFPEHGWEPLRYTNVTLSTTLGAAGFTTQFFVDTPHIIKDGFNFDKGFTGWEWIRGQENDRYITDASLKIELPCAPEKLRNPYTTFLQHARNTAWWRSEEDRFCARTMRKAMAWLEHNYKLEKFCLVVDTFDPHEPWDPPWYYYERYDPDYEGEVIPYPAYGGTEPFSQRELQHLRYLYAAELTLVDRWVGRLLDKIDEVGLRDRAMVIFTTDHGFMLGEHGWVGKGRSPLYLELNAIPLMIRYPGGPAGVRTDAFAQAPDLMPTILDAAGVPIPEECTGRSLLPLLRGEVEQVRDLAISSWQLPRRPEQRVLSVITEKEWCLHYYGPGGPHELYHLPSDPQQQRNRLETEREVAEGLHRRYVEFLRQIRTPADRLALRSRL
ncbi:MAG TPA: sulfatase [Armatimonadetes bacterium]|nr:sulfatase [Armatimonadota bacterium]